MGGRGCCFLCVCVGGLGSVSRISPLPCPIACPPWLLAPFLLAHALPAVVGLGGLVFNTWYAVACVSLCACVPSYLLAVPRRVWLYVFGCIAYLALLAAACLCVHSTGIPFALHAGVRGWAFCLGYTSSSVTFVGAVIVVLFPRVWRGVARNILLIVSSHGCPWWWCVWLPPCLYLALLAAACMRICGRHTFCSLCKRACGAGHVLPATPRGLCCAFSDCIVRRGSARNILVFGGRWCCGCLFVFGVLFLCVLYFPLVVCGSLCAFFVSFFHPSCPFIPCCLSVSTVALLCLW